MSLYYSHGGIDIHLGDCREILPQLGRFDLLLTDPPYPNTLEVEYHYQSDGLEFLREMDCRQFIFWTPSAPFPLDWSGKRVWDKAVGTATQFEEIYERNNASGYKIHRAYSMGCFSSVGAQMCGEVVTGHPSQKPLRLIKELLCLAPAAKTVLDPLCGSGTTLVAAKALGRTAVGIELHEPYAEIAAKRLAQEVLEFA